MFDLMHLFFFNRTLWQWQEMDRLKRYVYNYWTVTSNTSGYMYNKSGTNSWSFSWKQKVTPPKKISLILHPYQLHELYCTYILIVIAFINFQVLKNPILSWYLGHHRYATAPCSSVVMEIWWLLCLFSTSSRSSMCLTSTHPRRPCLTTWPVP